MSLNADFVRSARRSFSVSLLLTVTLSIAACSPTSVPSEAPTLNPPLVSDGMQATKECMEQAGFEVDYSGGGGLKGPEMPPEQVQLWLEANQRCMEESGLLDPYTESQLNELYDLEVENYECLLAAGYTPTAPPSRQQFIDAWETSQYSAIAGVAEAGGSALPQATAACPPPRWTFG